MAFERFRRVESLQRAAGKPRGPTVNASTYRCARSATAPFPLPTVRNVIAIGSGKGGVGKSTTAVNLALALAADGARVGVLDADVYGPSVPMMLGLTGRPDHPDGKTIEPMHAHGIEAMSIGLLVDQGPPMIWRGPMTTSALTQRLNDTRWGRPRLPDRRPAARHRRHPADAGAEDPGRRRGDGHHPAGCGHARCAQGTQDVRERRSAGAGRGREHGRVRVLELRPRRTPVRPKAAGRQWRRSTSWRLLGSLRLAIEIREQGDAGTPIVAFAPESATAHAYRASARRLAVALSLHPHVSRLLAVSLLGA